MTKTKTKTKTKPNGVVLWEGPSPVNGDRIAVIATGINKPSANAKTGKMTQVWIIPASKHPYEALQDKTDEAVCGQCPHRATTCYVGSYTTGNVFKAYAKGGYAKPPLKKDRISMLGARPLRWGAWGDPAFIPLDIIKRVSNAIPTLGYTHQWRNCDPNMRFFFMASVDTPEEYIEATKAGWRTYRVRLESEPLMPGEIACPADTVAWGERKTSCDACGLCNGKNSESDKRKNIASYVHGTGSKKFIAWRESLESAMEV